MRRSIRFRGFYLFPVLLLVTGCSPDQVVEMETLERHLLLTWIALEREDPDRVVEYNAAVQRDWSLLRDSYGATPVRTDLRQSASRVNLWMVNLHNAVVHEQPKRAMMTVNLIQNELRTLRPQLGVSHPADRLYDFYYRWQDVVAASNDPMLCLLEWQEYEELFEAAVGSWAAYVSYRPRFSDTLFPGYGERADEAEAAGIAMTRSLERFATLLEAADHTLAAEPSRMIDDLFFDYLAVVTAYPHTNPRAEASLR